MMDTIAVSSKTMTEFKDITQEIRRIVKKSGIADGICLIYVPHTTAGLTINENADRDVQADITSALSEMVPARGEYRHAEGNSPAHIQSTIVGNEKTVLVDRGELVLGTWQGIFFCEFDGPRQRKVYVKVFGTAKP